MLNQRSMESCVLSCKHGCYLLSTLCLALLIGCGSPASPARVQDTIAPKAEEVEQQEIALPQTEAIKASSIDDPVGLRLTVHRLADSIDEYEFTLEFDVADPYEIQSFRASPPKIPTEISLTLPRSFETVTDWEFPKPKRSLIPGASVSYSGKFECKRVIRAVKGVIAPDGVSIECTVKYQACDSSKCLRPTTSVLTLPFSAIP